MTKLVMTKYNFALMNCTDKKALQAPVVAKISFFALFFIIAKDRLGANPSTIKISQCVLWVIHKDQLAPQ